MSKIKTINSFIDQQDCKDMIAVVDELMLSVDRVETGKDDDSRFVFFRPSDEVSVAMVKKYAKKVIEASGHDNLYLHDVIYAKSEPGATVAVHMDFDTISECDHCPLASVLYLNRDYSGGEIYFPKLNEEYSPQAGSVAMFPQDDEDYVHGVRTVADGVRYIVNICYTTEQDRQLDIYK